ncbi:hypothetical protein H6771_03110 [Candidatus Peribacteria bacterium]|nr:hypothetical protein [Candidatus Peribacteria bacterium]
MRLLINRLSLATRRAVALQADPSAALLTAEKSAENPTPAAVLHQAQAIAEALHLPEDPQPPTLEDAAHTVLSAPEQHYAALFSLWGALLEAPIPQDPLAALALEESLTGVREIALRAALAQGQGAESLSQYYHKHQGTWPAKPYNERTVSRAILTGAAA